jgi:hypothetical protein
VCERQTNPEDKVTKRDFFMLFARLAFEDPNGEVTADWLKAFMPPIAHAALDSNQEVFWIVTEGNDRDICADGEFGVEIGGKAYLYYKYSSTGPSSPEVKYRRIEKREFGEVIRKS